MSAQDYSEIALYIVTHKCALFNYPAYVIPIQAGAALTNQHYCSVTDHTGNNISVKNHEFCELTALYWIWKNDFHNIIGLNHYRRNFSIEASAIYDTLKSCDLIIPPPYYFRMSLKKEYEKYHINSDLLLFSQIVDDMHPEMSSTFQDVLDGNMLIPYNMFITNRKLMDDYCSELFPILFRLEKELILDNRNLYQKRVFGFLSERYFTAYVRKMGLKAYICPVRIPETAYPIRKMKYFCGRKFNQFYFEYMTKKNKGDESYKRI